MTVNGAVTAKEYEYTVPAAQEVALARLLILIEDTAIQPSYFAGINAGLTIGLQLEIIDTDDSVILDFLDGNTIKAHTEFGLVAGNDNLEVAGAGADVVLIRWTLSRFGAPLRLLAGQRFRLTVQDDLSSLNKFEAMVQGLIVQG